MGRLKIHTGTGTDACTEGTDRHDWPSRPCRAPYNRQTSGSGCYDEEGLPDCTPPVRPVAFHQKCHADVDQGQIIKKSQHGLFQSRRLHYKLFTVYKTHLL